MGTCGETPWYGDSRPSGSRPGSGVGDPDRMRASTSPAGARDGTLRRPPICAWLSTVRPPSWLAGGVGSAGAVVRATGPDHRDDAGPHRLGQFRPRLHHGRQVWRQVRCHTAVTAPGSALLILCFSGVRNGLLGVWGCPQVVRGGMRPTGPKVLYPLVFLPFSTQCGSELASIWPASAKIK